jgi:hypothetical protein
MNKTTVFATAMFGLLALLWTGGAASAAWVVQWAAQALADGGVAAAGRDFASLPVPQWLALWLDPALLQAVRSALLWTPDAAGTLLPAAGSAAGWLVPVWVLWGFGLAALR